jgi:signal transduction histidine kinase
VLQVVSYSMLWWCRLSLAGQFVLLSSVLIGVAMAVIGTWVSSVIEDRLLQQIGASRAVYLDSFISPLSQDLADAPDLKPESREALSRLFSEKPLQRHVVSVKIWALGGRVVHSTSPEIVGKQYPVAEQLAKAYAGQVSVQIEEPYDDEEHEFERRLGKPLFEIYSPVRELGTDRIIGAAELYEVADQHRSDMRWAGIQSWLIVGLITLCMIGALFSIVRRGSRTIISQKQALVNRVDELSRLLSENRELQARIRLANVEAANLNEQFLRRVGADLHDGPAQLVSLALLLLDRVKSAGPDGFDQNDDFCRTHDALADALMEIRHISAGLAPPEVERLTPAEVIKIVARSHERRTGTSVRCEIGELPVELCPLIKTCMYRFAQEGLNNAFKHARGRGQSIRAWWEDQTILVEVNDTGPGVHFFERRSTNSLGLAGLRARIEALGGSFELQSWPSVGTRLAARFRIRESDLSHG